jgi:hypothetical protein
MQPAAPRLAQPVSEEQLRAVGTVPQSLLPNQRARRDAAPPREDAPPGGLRDTMMPVATPAVVIRSQAPKLNKRQKKRAGVLAGVLVGMCVVGVVGARFLPPAKGDAAVLAPMGASLPNDTRAQLRLLAAVDATREYFLDHGTYEDVTTKDLAKREAAFGWKGPKGDAGKADISVDVTGDAEITLASEVESGVCAFARDIPTEARTETTVVHTDQCRAEDAPESGWGRIDFLL